MVEQASFNLVREPWIRVVDHDGLARLVSLAGLLEQAPEIRQISGELPTQDMAILRLTLAILHRALDGYAPTSTDDTPASVEAFDQHWHDAVVPAVMKYLSKHENRFNLFDQTAPFFQVAGMETAKGEFSDLSKLVADMPTGEPYLTTRSARDIKSIEPAEAARWLVHLHAYDTSGIKTGVVGHPRAQGGRVYPEGTGWTGQLGLVYLLGATLKTTLLLNLWAVLLSDEERTLDLPPWECPAQTLQPVADLRNRPYGPVDVYTWQPRRVLLHGGPAGVTGVLVTYGDRFILQERQGTVRREPMSLWRYSKPQSAKYKYEVQMTRKHRTGSALWRGIAAVLPGTSPSGSSGKEPGPAPTAIVQHAQRLSSANSPLLQNGLVRYQAVGLEYGAQEAVVDDIFEDGLDIPASVLGTERKDARNSAIHAAKQAQHGARALADLARGLARAAGAHDDGAIGRGDRAYEQAYAALDRPYRDWLRTSLANVNDLSVAEAAWDKAARRILERQGEALVRSAPDRAWRGYGAAGKRDDVGVLAQRFHRDLGRTFPRSASPEPSDTSDDSNTQEDDGLIEEQVVEDK